jgi:CPA2 family monovalent cation:H+ antiporter-2
MYAYLHQYDIHMVNICIHLIFNILGAFLAGLLLAETKYKYQIEADIAPFRGLLLGFFFITVGFNIDLSMIVKEAPKIAAMLTSLIVGKAAIITALSLAFGISFANAQQSGLMLAQGGEFAFVALGIAEKSGLVEPSLCKLLLTTVALSMAATPLLAELGGSVAKKLDKERGLTYFMGQDSDAEEMKSDSKDFVLVAGYGRVGKMVCDMLDRIPVRYIALDSSPTKAIKAREKGLPVFYGDINRPEVLRNFDVGAARAVVFAIDDMSAINKAVINVRKLFPDLPLLVKAKNMQHQKRLEKMFDNIYVMSPVFQNDDVLLTLPFGGAVLQNLGMSPPEIEAILEEYRKEYMESDKNVNDETFNFLSQFERKKPPIIIKEEINEKKEKKEIKNGDPWKGTNLSKHHHLYIMV